MGDGPEIETPDGEPRTRRRDWKISEDTPIHPERDEHDNREPRVREELIPEVRPASRHSQYASRKTVAQGMMDVALILANASQLKSVLETGPTHAYYWFLCIMIVLSILLQVLTGIVLLMVGSRELRAKDDPDVNKLTNRLNNVSVAMIFLVTTVNVFIASFGISDKTAERLKSATGNPSSTPGN